MTLARFARPARPTCIKATAIFFLVVIAYLPVLFTSGFIWDDPQYITGNPLLRTWRGLAAIWIHPSALPQYYPLVHTTFWIEYHIAGLHPFLYHLDNILLHALAAILLWRALVRLNVPAAWLAAAIFAIHPVQVESVAWATERKNVLSLVFYLLSFHAYWNFLNCNRIRDFILALLLFACALLSKSVTCSLPAAILLILYWQTGRLRLRDILPLIPFFACGVAMAFVTAHIEFNHVGASGPEWNFTPLDRFLIAGRALWFYAEKLIWPHPLIFIYPRWRDMSFSLRPSLILFPLSALGVFASLWLLRRRIGRGPLVAVLFFAGTLLPALGFINLYPMRYSFVADHFQYHASIGLIVLAAIAIRRLGAPVFTLSAGVILVILGTLTWHQGSIYQNQLILWTDVTQRNPTSWMAWGNLGDEYAALSNRPDLPQSQRDADRATARACYSKLYELAPDEPLAHLKWGIVKEYDGDLPAAEAEFTQALRLQPQFTLAMNSMGLILAREHRLDDAIKYYEKALSLDPNYAEARVHYADALYGKGDKDRALDEYLEAASRRPDNVEAQFTSGNLLLTDKNRPDLAIPHYVAALYADPNRADIRVNLAAALMAAGQFDDAREQCRIALQIDPNLPQAQQLWKRLSP
jgi:tetratricopeptide (TPR) repeat protein